MCGREVIHRFQVTANTTNSTVRKEMIRYTTAKMGALAFSAQAKRIKRHAGMITLKQRTLCGIKG